MPKKQTGKSFASNVIKHEMKEIKSRKSCDKEDKKVISQAKKVLKKK